MQERLCTLCSTANVEDVSNFVCHCQINNNVRTNLFYDAIELCLIFLFNFLSIHTG